LASSLTARWSQSIAKYRFVWRRIGIATRHGQYRTGLPPLSSCGAPCGGAFLPYKSKAEQEAERWITLPQAIAHISAADSIDERSARRELLKALTDDMFRSRFTFLVRWQDKTRISGEATPSQISRPDVPPRGEEWTRAKIRWASGKVLDPFGALVNGEWRPAWRTVLVYRSKVIELWHLSPPAKTPTASASNEHHRPSQRKRGRKPKKRMLLIDAMTMDVKRRRMTVEMLRKLPDKKLITNYGDKIGAKRTSCREARDAVLAEFDGNSNAVD